jgi:DNA-binding LytR/AlgR family response regulator
MCAHGWQASTAIKAVYRYFPIRLTGLSLNFACRHNAHEPMTRPSAIIADDEPRLAEDLAAQLRAAWPQLDIVTIAANGLDAAAAIAAHQPAFAFLDINMPGLDGIQVAKLAQTTRVIFVTAHAEYAVNAFEAAAVDYLLKPVSNERLARCVARLLQPRTAVMDVGALTALLSQPAQSYLEWLTVRLGDTTRLVAVNEVLYFRAGDKYTEAVTATEGHLVRTSLKELLEQLPPRRFVQIHRSLIVNLREIERIEHNVLGRPQLHLKKGAGVLSVSRSFAAQFRQM